MIKVDLLIRLSVEERKLYRNTLANLFTNNPFVITFDDIENANIRNHIRAYILKDFNVIDEDNDPLRFMPFNILLNRLTHHNINYNKICCHVYEKVKHNDYDLGLFMKILFDRQDRIPIKIIDSLAKLNYQQFSNKSKLLNREVENRELAAVITEDYSKEEDDDLNINSKLDKFLLHSCLAIDCNKLEEWGYNRNTVINCWLYDNFYDNAVPFNIVFNRLYKAKQYNFLNELIKLVEDNVIKTKNKKYFLMYVLMTQDLVFFDDQADYYANSGEDDDFRVRDPNALKNFGLCKVVT